MAEFDHAWLCVICGAPNDEDGDCTRECDHTALLQATICPQSRKPHEWEDVDDEDGDLANGGIFTYHRCKRCRTLGYVALSD